MTTKVDLTLKKGDTRPVVSGIVKDEDRNPVDLTGATVEFRMYNVDSEQLVVDAAGSVRSPPDDGKVAYDWQDGDTDTVGFYQAEFVVDYNGGSGDSFDGDQTFPAESSDEYIVIEILETLK